MVKRYLRDLGWLPIGLLAMLVTSVLRFVLTVVRMREELADAARKAVRS